MNEAPRASSSRLWQLSEHRWAVAIRRGFLLLLPLVMVGAFSVVLGNVPWPSDVFSLSQSDWQNLCERVSQTSFGIISLCLVITISHALIAQSQEGINSEINPLVPAIVASVSFLVLVVPGDGPLKAELFGNRSVFIALITAIASTEIFLYVLRRPWLRSLKSFNDADPLLPGLLRSIVPAIATITVFIFLRSWLDSSDRSVGAMLAMAIEGLFEPIESPLLRALLFNLLTQSLWFVGAHGNNILAAVEHRFLESATAANAAAVAAGGVPTEIVTKPFFDVFIFMGGSGTALGLIIALLLVCQRSNQQKLARLGFVPALFNISEIVVYGLPVVFNPIFFAPFVLTPLALTLTTYAACMVGFIPPIHQAISWTTPPLVGGYLASGSWHGVALQIVNLTIAVGIYVPFVRAAQRRANESRQKNFRQLLSSMDMLMSRQGASVLSRTDAVGGLARQLAGDLMPDVKQGRVRLVYQPQVDQAGKVVGVEALLRWDHEIFGPVPPNIAVGIAEEASLICELGHWVMDSACRQLKLWRVEGEYEVGMSVNLSPTQLHEPGFTDRLRACLKRHGLSASELELEITESRAVGHDDATVATMAELAEMGVRLAMDDFGMGYSSLLYMRRFRIHAIKLDGSLTREVVANRSCQDIIETIAHLCHNKDVRIIAEFVETEDQRDLLNALGCTEYQGYLYSKPLSPEDCLEFIRIRNNAHRRQASEAQSVSLPTAEVVPLRRSS